MADAGDYREPPSPAFQRWWLRSVILHCSKRVQMCISSYHLQNGRLGSIRATSFNGDSAQGSSPETWARWGWLRGALGFVQRAQADSASVLARRLLAEMCRHFTCSVFCLELTSYRNNLKLKWGWEEVQIQCLILENAQLPSSNWGKIGLKTDYIKKMPLGFLGYKIVFWKQQYDELRVNESETYGLNFPWICMDLEVMEKRALGKRRLRFYPTENIWEILWGALVDPKLCQILSFL